MFFHFKREQNMHSVPVSSVQVPPQHNLIYQPRNQPQRKGGDTLANPSYRFVGLKNALYKEPVSVKIPAKGYTPDKLYWGKSFWFFFHTISAQLDPVYFEEAKPYLINMISGICGNLPCPHCSSHATEYLQQNPLHLIKTKEELEEYLFTFHNVVNVRKTYDLFPREKLNEYKTKNILQIFDDFFRLFQASSKNMHFISDTGYRRSLAKLYTNWLSTHLYYFKPTASSASV